MPKNVLPWNGQSKFEFDFPPADLYRVAKVQWIQGFFALLEVADIKIGKRMVDESMHGAIWAVHVLVDHPRDEVWSEGDNKCLGIGVGEVVVGVEVQKFREGNRS